MIEALPPAWDPERDDTLVCVAVRAETHDISTFVFAAPEPRLFRFLPGQFMTFELPAAGELDGAEVQRCYTIASPPTRPWRIEITAKRAPTGPGSGWLHRALQPGMRVRATGPMGEFVHVPEPGRKLLFLSAGSGVTPVMSMARTLHDLGSEADVLFLHSARSPIDIPFAAELDAMSRRPGFRWVGIVEGDAPEARWNGFRGRLSPAVLAMLAPDLPEREVFCCGPAPYMAAVRTMLREAGHEPSRYHEESFAFAVPPEPPEPEVATAAPPLDVGAYTVRFARQDRAIECPAGSTVLAAARAAGVRLPSACAKGVCGTCKSTLLSGSVELRHGGGIRQREIDAGMTLLCCARPTSDLVVDR